MENEGIKTRIFGYQRNKDMAELRPFPPACSLRGRHSRVFIAVLVVFVAFSGGCRRVSPASNTSVRGVVTFQGQPVGGGLVVFCPDPERGGSGTPIPGQLSQDGSFQLNLGGEPTIPPGWYRVAIAPAPMSRSSSQTFSVFPPQLARPDQSGLIREVKPGQENWFEFVIEVK